MAKQPQPCTCSEFRTASGKTTGCTQTTTGRFAPGHDAKVKSFLIQAGADGEQVIRQLADTSVTADAVSHAADLGYSVKVTDGIDREVARRTARSLDDLGKAREPKASNELAEAARRSDEEFRAAERRKIQDREASAGW